MTQASAAEMDDQLSRRTAQETLLKETRSCHRIIPGLWLGSNDAFLVDDMSLHNFT